MKVDGPTKEEFVWGFRTGMLTFGTRATTSTESLYKALEKKVTGAIRSHGFELFALGAERAGEGPFQRDDQGRAQGEAGHPPRSAADRCHEILKKPEYAELLGAYPFNAGYFMCVKLKGIDANTFRKHLLDKYGVGVIADGEHDIRVAFSAVDVGELEDLFAQMGAAAKDLLEGGSA